MHRLGRAFDGAFAGGTKMIGFEFDGGEPACAFGKIGETSVACGGIGEGDNTASMQKTIGRHKRLRDWQLGLYFRRAHVRDDHAKVPRQIPGTAFVELFWRVHEEANVFLLGSSDETLMCLIQFYSA